MTTYTKAEQIAMLYAGEGHDIYNRAAATVLRGAHKKDPEAFVITKPMKRPPIGQQQPFFGCMIPTALLMSAEEASGLSAEADEYVLLDALSDALTAELEEKQAAEMSMTGEG